MKSSGGLLSFKEWLCIAFLVMACIFAAVLIILTNSLAPLHRLSLDTTYYATSLNSRGSELFVATQSMERRARQHLILHDEESFANFIQVSRQTDQIISDLLKENAIPEQIAQQWHGYTAQIAQRLSSSIATGNEANNTATQQIDLNSPFKQLELLQADILLNIQQKIDQRHAIFSNDIDHQQQLMRNLMVGLIVSALIMAFAFGTWLARPFKRIESAIVNLGENQFDQPIHIKGPTDVQKLGLRLDWLRMRLAEIDADKARFLRHTSHEFKTPLASLREGISLLQEELAGSLNSSQKNVVQILQQNAIILQNQIEDLLQFNAAAFDARKLTRKPVNLLELVEDQVDGQQLQWQANSIQIKVAGEPVIAEVDASKIGTAISNLLSNAIRFAPPDSEISIHVFLQDQHAYIDIIDQGPGVDEQDRLHIFDPFYRGKIQPISKTRGSGIGLSIVHEYVVAHGGKISLMPNDTGAYFRIELPYAKL